MKVTFLEYSGPKEHEISIPENLKWCNSPELGWNNYWTIIPNTFTNKRKILKNFKVFYSNTYYFKDFIALCINKCSEIPELELIEPEALIEEFKLRDYVFIKTTLNTNRVQVSKVFKIKDVKHPNNVITSSIVLNNLYSFREECIALLEDKVKLADDVTYPYKHEYIISNNYKIWESAIREFNYRMFGIPFEDQPYKWSVDVNGNIIEVCEEYSNFKKQF